MRRYRRCPSARRASRRRRLPRRRLRLRPPHPPPRLHLQRRWLRFPMPPKRRRHGAVPGSSVTPTIINGPGAATGPAASPSPPRPPRPRNPQARTRSPSSASPPQARRPRRDDGGQGRLNRARCRPRSNGDGVAAGACRLRPKDNRDARRGRRGAAVHHRPCRERTLELGAGAEAPAAAIDARHCQHLARRRAEGYVGARSRPMPKPRRRRCRLRRHSSPAMPAFASPDDLPMPTTYAEALELLGAAPTPRSLRSRRSSMACARAGTPISRARRPTGAYASAACSRSTSPGISSRNAGRRRERAPQSSSSEDAFVASAVSVAGAFARAVAAVPVGRTRVARRGLAAMIGSRSARSMNWSAWRRSSSAIIGGLSAAWR